MKKDTVVRLHLTKQLLESLTKQVIAEAKKSGDMSGGAYTEAVKEPKGAKKGEKSEALNLSKNEKPNVMPTGDEKKQAAGASKGQVSTTLMQRGRDLAKDSEANVQSGEGGVFLRVNRKLLDILDDKDNASMILGRVEKLIDQLKKSKPVTEMETEVAEENLQEVDLTDPMVVAPALAFLGSAAAVVTSLLKDLKNAKTPEERKQILQNISNSIERSKGTNEVVEKKKESLKECEVIYVVHDGKCYRKDDENNMDEVSMSKCK